MQALELRIPPVALVVCLAGLMWLVALSLPAATWPLPGRVPAAVALALGGLAVALAGVAAFRRAHTTVNPTTPQASSTVVASGIYQHSRNPMYVGFLLVLASWAVYLANGAAALLVPVFVLYMNRFQIQIEERALVAKFGAQYTDYMQRVRRWV